MATYTRVLLKARSFAGASLRESSAHRNNGQRNFARASLREDQLTYQREKECSPQNAVNKMEYVQARFTNPCKTLSKDFASKSFSENYVVSNSRPYTTGYVKAGDEYHNPELTNKDDNCVDGKFDERHTFTKVANILVLNTSTLKEHLKHNEECCTPRNSEPLTLGNIANTDRPVKKDIYYCSKSKKTVDENTSLTEPNLSHSTITSCKKELTGSTHLHKTSLMIPDSVYYEDSKKLQNLRTQSFTGMVTHRPIFSSSQTLSEVHNDHKSSKKSTSSFKVTQGEESVKSFHIATTTRRARVSRDGYAFRFSSDLGPGTSSKVKPKSKQEVFV